MDDNLFEELSELIYITDLTEHKLLYVNRFGRRSLSLPEDYAGKPCYQLLQGFDEPCPFCTNHLLHEGEYYSWEHTNRINGHHYLVRDTLVTYEGKKARLEAAFDITDQQRTIEILRSGLEGQNTLVECVRELVSATPENIGQMIRNVLGRCGVYLSADRAYLFQSQSGHMNNTIEWCADGVEPQIEQLQDVTDVISRWRVLFQTQQYVIIEDVESLRTVSPTEYRALSAQGVRTLIAVPLMQEGELCGFVGLDNPPIRRVRDILPMLTTLCYFIGLILEQMDIRKELDFLSYRDALTGAFNRNAYIRDLEYPMVAMDASLGVVFVDVNGLKELNDTQGHAAGDRLIEQTAAHILAVFPKDHLYRVGGDEFVILTSGLSQAVFAGKVQELRSLFAKGIDRQAAIGARWSPYGTQIEKLIYEADEAMYADKRDFYREKGAGARYRPQMDDILGLTEPEAIQKAIGLGRFQVYFQPQVSLVDDQTLVGSEALCRYVSASGKVIAPGEYIPALEEHRLIAPLDFHILRQVCGYLAEWTRAGEKIAPVSVNFSRYSLSVFDFVGTVLKICESYNFARDLLKIEITESVEEEDETNFLRVVTRLRQAGFAVSIDDFGVRHANLALFTACDFDELKLDRRLVSDVCKSAKARAVIRAVTDICWQVGTDLIAEGVETLEQAETLRGVGCTRAQGYYYDKPMPAGQFRKKYMGTSP